MDIRYLDLLRELAARGSVTAVAQATYRTPSAVSQQLKAAQREFGVVLAEPSGRGLVLTEAGRLLAESGEDVAIARERAAARWDAFRGAPSGRVSIAALPSAALFLLPELLVRFAGSGIELVCTDIDTAELEYPKLVADHDIVVAHSMGGPYLPGTEELSVMPLVREPLDVAMATNHPLASRETLTPADVVEHEWIGVPHGYPFDTVLTSLAHTTGRDLRIVQRLIDNRLVEVLVAQNDYLAILPRFTTPRNTGLQLRALDGVESSRDVMALSRKDRAERLAVRHVLDVMTQVTAELAAGTKEPAPYLRPPV